MIKILFAILVSFTSLINIQQAYSASKKQKTIFVLTDIDYAADVTLLGEKYATTLDKKVSIALGREAELEKMLNNKDIIIASCAKIKSSSLLKHKEVISLDPVIKKRRLTLISHKDVPISAQEIAKSFLVVGKEGSGSYSKACLFAISNAKKDSMIKNFSTVLTANSSLEATAIILKSKGVGLIYSSSAIGIPELEEKESFAVPNDLLSICAISLRKTGLELLDFMKKQIAEEM